MELTAMVMLSFQAADLPNGIFKGEVRPPTDTHIVIYISQDTKAYWYCVEVYSPEFILAYFP